MRVPVHQVHGKPKEHVETTEDVLATALAKRYTIVRERAFDTVVVAIAIPKHRLAVEIRGKQDNKAILAEMAKEKILRAHGWVLCLVNAQEIRGDIDNVLYKVQRDIERNG